jgi:hypothetical protein
MTPVLPLRCYQQHEWTGGGGHGLITGGGHGLITGGGQMMIGSLMMMIGRQQFVFTTGRTGKQHAEACCDTPTSSANAATIAINVFMVYPFLLGSLLTLCLV